MFWVSAEYSEWRVIYCGVYTGLKKKITKDEIRECPVRYFDGPVHVISEHDDTLRAVESLSKEAFLGFDTETRPVFRKGLHYLPALLQVAGERDVYLFQLKKTGLPDSLRRLLADQGIIKAGVAVSYDLSELRKISDFTPGGFVELAQLAESLGIENRGLRGLAALLMGIRITKGASTSNWENSRLTDAQIRYAATDAWVGRELYKIMTVLKKEKEG